VLTTGDKTQNLAAKSQFDQEVFKLISVCVKVTARGYDGEAGTADEDKWQAVINSCRFILSPQLMCALLNTIDCIVKKLLITCLQFLNNLVARNERRKLMLWVELFDSSTDSVLPHNPSDLTSRPEFWPRLNEDSGIPLTKSSGQQDKNDPAWPAQQPVSSPFLLYISKMGIEVKRDLVEKGEKGGATEIAAECKKRWQSMAEEEKNVSCSSGD